VTGDAVQRLLDIEAIKQLKARYFRYMDQKRWDEWGDVFARDAVLEVPDANMVTTGRDTIVAGVSSLLEGARTVHHGHMPEIEVTGSDTARGTWAMFDYVEWPASAEDGARVGLQGFGHYVEEYTREDGEWRISRSRLERLRVDPLPNTSI
jgi:SnoaL-like protein